MQEISMMFVKSDQWDGFIPMTEFTKNTFMSDFAGKRDMTMPFTTAFVSGEENVTRRKFSLRRHFRLLATGGGCRWVLK